MPTCPVRPIIVPEDQSECGGGWITWTSPAPSHRSLPRRRPRFLPCGACPSGSDDPVLSKSGQQLHVRRGEPRVPLAAHINDMVVVRIKAPTFVNTQGGRAAVLEHDHAPGSVLVDLLQRAADHRGGGGAPPITRRRSAMDMRRWSFPIRRTARRTRCSRSTLPHGSRGEP